MATPGNVLAFYAEKRWGNRHGIKGPLYGAAGHRGHDIKTAAREAVPALRGGKVVYTGRSSVLGPVVVIEVGPGNYDGYAHLYGLKVETGDHVAQGEIIALTAGVGDYHGTAWLGPHLHITNGALSGSVFAGATRDPAPGIRDILADVAVLAPASTPSKPAPVPAKAPAPTIRKEVPEMFLMRITSGEVYLITSRGKVQLTHPSHIVLFQRMFKTYPDFDTFNAAERDILTSYILRAS